MGSGGSQQTDLRKPEFFKREGRAAAQDQYLSGTAADRRRGAVDYFGGSIGSTARGMGLDPAGARSAINTGVAGFTGDQLAARNALRNFSGPDFGAANASLGAASRVAGQLEDFDLRGSVGDAEKRLLAFRSGAAGDINALRDFESEAGDLAQERLANFNPRDPTQGEQFLTETAGGKFLEGNPHLAKMIQATQNRTQDQFRQALVDSSAQFTGAGSSNNSMQGQYISDITDRHLQNLGDIDTQLSFDTYNLERQLMSGAQGQLAGLETDRLGLDLEGRIAAGQNANQMSGQQLAALQAALEGQLTADQQGITAATNAGQLGIQGSSIEAQALANALQGRIGIGGIQSQNANAAAAMALQKAGMLNQFGTQEQDLMQRLAMAPQVGRDQRFAELGAFSSLLHPGGNVSLGGNRSSERLGAAATGAGIGSAIYPGVGTAVGAAGGYLLA